MSKHPVEIFTATCLLRSLTFVVKPKFVKTTIKFAVCELEGCDFNFVPSYDKIIDVALHKSLSVLMYCVVKTQTPHLNDVQMRCCVQINYSAFEHSLPPLNCGRNIANKSIQHFIAAFCIKYD